MEKTKYYSYKQGKLPQGCRQCVKGSKLVLFITGICCRKCTYCPISDQKHDKDVIYADELPVKSIKDVFLEAKLINATGAGITGGDPLCRVDRVVKYIVALKKEFGSKFHIHLYTSFNLINLKMLSRLHKAGLDEIRFHADVEDSKLWSKIDLVNKFKWDVGIEIPIFPGKFVKTQKLIDYFSSQVNFINLNELEFADNSFSKLPSSYKPKDSLSYGVKGSEELALKILRYCSKYPKLNVHYCTAKLKDRVQMANRIKRRAENVAEAYDLITDEGLLFRGAIYGSLVKIERALLSLKINSKLYFVDKKRKRVLVDPEWKDDHKDKLKKFDFKLALVEEYPTYDCLNVVTDFI
jgi:pyruvate formate-lyase activating enzyme-like uncharacterized protein